MKKKVSAQEIFVLMAEGLPMTYLLYEFAKVLKIMTRMGSAQK